MVKKDVRRVVRLYASLAASLCTLLALGTMTAKAPHAAGD
jgi:hypothetical protein